MNVVRRSSILIIGVLGLLLGPGGQAAMAATTQWAWAALRVPGSPTPPYPDALDQAISTGATNYFTSPATGEYKVWFPGITAPLGVVHVSVFGAAHRVCIPSPGVEASDTAVIVDCYDDTHVSKAANATFVVSYLTSDAAGMTNAA